MENEAAWEGAAGPRPVPREWERGRGPRESFPAPLPQPRRRRPTQSPEQGGRELPTGLPAPGEAGGGWEPGKRALPPQPGPAEPLARREIGPRRVRRKGDGAATPTFQRLLQPLDVHGFTEPLAASASFRGSPGDWKASPHPPDALPLPCTHSGTQATGGGTEGSRGKRAREPDRDSEHLPEPLPPALQHGARHVIARTLPAAVLAPAARPDPEPESACAARRVARGSPPQTRQGR